MVIISNGFAKFHLSVAAAEADRRHLLSSFLTGAYPTPFVQRILSLPYLRTNAKANRLAARRDEITEGLVHPLFPSEALYVLGTRWRNGAVDVGCMRFYGRLACRHVERAAAQGARIYHYRAGFGGASLEVARKRGLFLLCDHSIAHPLMIDALVRNAGRMPAREELSASRIWMHVLHDIEQADIEQADAVLVNSRFVQDTFRHVGHNRSPVHVIYWGIDDSFLDRVPQRESAPGDFRLLFAGFFDKRKGADVLMDALGRLDDIPWHLEIAGPVGSDVAVRSRDFFSHPRVKYLGTLSRRDLAIAMTRADVFVFPSLAEGSARVVFEALACGCFVITTANSGSIVEDGVHGAIVPSGDSAALAEAITCAYQHRDRVSAISRNNALCIREQYRQCDYGDKLMGLYKELLGES
jgi:glycosyltransferase involved in cell wall biosynthesis